MNLYHVELDGTAHIVALDDPCTDKNCTRKHVHVLTPEDLDYILYSEGFEEPDDFRPSEFF